MSHCNGNISKSLTWFGSIIKPQEKKEVDKPYVLCTVHLYTYSTLLYMLTSKVYLLGQQVINASFIEFIVQDDCV